MNNRLMIFAFLGFSLFLLGCVQPAPVATPTPVPTAIATATAVPTVAATPEATPTAVVVAAPSVEVTQAPASAVAASAVSFSWKVNAPAGTKATHTSVHWDVASRPGAFGLDVTPASSGYGNLISTFAKGEFDLPREFSGQITPPAGGVAYTVYYRAHAIIDGKNYWTAEQRLSVSPGGAGAPVVATPTPVQTQVQEFRITLEHATGFSQTSFVADKGTRVRFLATTSTPAHMHGMKISGYPVDTEVTSSDPANPTVIEFVADKLGEFAITCSTKCAQSPFGTHTWFTAKLTVR